MTHHVGPGPVFVFEWLVTSRKQTLYSVRSLFVALLLAALTITWVETENRQPTLNKTQLSYRDYAKIGETFFYVNRKPGTPVDPKVREFIRYILSRQGQQAVARDGKYLPLTANALREQRRKLD